MTVLAAKHAQGAASVSGPRKPRWLRRCWGSAGRKAAVERQMVSGDLRTVCEEARCPNRAECFGRGTATFLILGDTCTRGCRFCAIGRGAPRATDSNEPRRVADAAEALGLDYVVVTSVTRDDLPDGGAGHFAAVVRALRRRLPRAMVEVLVPDFGGSREALAAVLHSGPQVLNHNVETVPRLYAAVRPQASIERSLGLLAAASARPGAIMVKSGLMVGLGERPDEVTALLARLAAAGCSMVTIGQYLQPSAAQVPVAEFVQPRRFEWYASEGRRLGIAQVVSGPYVRSSYRARDSARALVSKLESHRCVEGGS